jgi:hypothetical protein
MQKELHISAQSLDNLANAVFGEANKVDDNISAQIAYACAKGTVQFFRPAIDM